MKVILVTFIFFFKLIVLSQPVTNSTEENQAPVQKKEDKSLKNKEVLDSLMFNEPMNKNREEREKSTDEELQIKKTSFSKTKSSVQTQRTQKNPSPQQQEVLNQTVEYYQRNAPNSFEYHYFKYLAGNYDFSLIQHLKEAEKLKPENVEVSIQFVAYYYLQSDTASAAVYLKKLVDKKRLSESLLYYAQDVLSSIDENNTLVTHGVDDTYAALYWQLCKKYRTDVRIVSLDFLQAKAEINQLKKEKFNLPNQTLIDTNYFKSFVTLNPQKTFAIALTLPKEYLKTIASNIHVHGLVFSYASETNTKDFFHCEYLWDQKLNKKVILEPYTEQAKTLSANYLPMLFVMRKVYKNQNQEEKCKEIDLMIDKISIQSQKNKEVDNVRKKF
jgi:hypothetical protein